MNAKTPSRNHPGILVRNPDTVQKWLKYLHNTSGLTDREIARKPYFSGIPAGTINTIRNHGYIPEKWHRKLHILTPVKVMPCTYCEVVHIGQCPYGGKPRKPYKRTPGGWINGRDPRKAAHQLAKKVNFPLVDLIGELNKIYKETRRDAKAVMVVEFNFVAGQAIMKGEQEL